MNNRLGATPEEWDFWAQCAPKDLLPVVCRRGVPIASGSKLSDYGKVPSLYNLKKEVSGIAQWTSKQSSPDLIAAWRGQPDYGICLQTRTFRAIDCDLEDRGLAEAAQSILLSCFPGLSFRTRSDSSKFLALLELEGDLGKRVIRTPAGVIEFLANGQQCLVAGTHTKGARYDWTRSESGALVIPKVVLDAANNVWEMLSLALGIGEPTESRVRKARGQSVSHAGGAGSDDAGAPTSGGDRTAQASRLRVEDPVAQLLHGKGVVRATDADGRIHFWCPWKSDHSRQGDVTETTYFPAGTGGFERGHFRCLHAHCEARSDGDFLDALGWTLDGFEVEPDEPVSGAHEETPEDRAILASFGVHESEDLVGPATPPAVPSINSVIPPSSRDTKTGTQHPVLNNVVLALEHPEITHIRVAFDTFKDEQLISWDGGTNWTPVTDDDYTKLNVYLVRQFKFNPKLKNDVVRLALNRVANARRFDSGVLWATRLPEWDGVERIEHFYPRYLHTEDTPYARALGLYQWTAQAARLMQPGAHVDIVPVWVSGQGTGKTSAVRALVEAREHYAELDLSDHGDDLKRQMRGLLVGELNELHGLKGRAKQWTKGFVSRQDESWTPKYMEKKTTYQRRFVMIGTTNEEEFLEDETGNRRWAPIRVGDTQEIGLIERDRLQLWSEGIARWKQEGIIWKPVTELARAEHHKYEVQDEWEDRIWQYLNREEFDGPSPILRTYFTTSEVIQHGLGMEPRTMNGRCGARVGAILRRLGFRQESTRIAGKRTKIWISELTGLV